MKTTKKEWQRGIPSLIAKSVDCHPQYVRMVLSGERDGKSELARKIVRKAEQLEQIINN